MPATCVCKTIYILNIALVVNRYILTVCVVYVILQSFTATYLNYCIFSDGAEKCGLLCAVYLMLDKLNAEQVVDVFNAVKKIRADRPQFITSEVCILRAHHVNISSCLCQVVKLPSLPVRYHVQYFVLQEQYSFLHDVANEYMDTFGLYANFK